MIITKYGNQQSQKQIRRAYFLLALTLFISAATFGYSYHVRTEVRRQTEEIKTLTQCYIKMLEDNDRLQRRNAELEDIISNSI